MKRDQFRLSGKSGISDQTPYRSAFRHDYGRLIHSPAFRRLQNKTQLYPGLESDFFRNRLTHSMEVANVGVGIAETLNATVKELADDPIDLDLVAFAGLAHDLGHPPFGHNGEKALDDLMKGYGGFEGNAQTLRILTRIEKKALADKHNDLADRYNRLGLDLTFRSLAAILKYDKAIPEKRDKNADLVKGYYQTEQKIVQEIKRAVGWNGQQPKKFKSVECQIMDLADDISYSTYDLEDTLKSGFLTPADLIGAVEQDDSLREKIRQKTQESVGKRVKIDIPNVLNEIFFEGEYEKLNPHDAHTIGRAFCNDGYTRTALTSWLVGFGIRSAKYKPNPINPALAEVYLDRDALIRAEVLKHLNYELTIRSSRLAVVQHRGYEVVGSIFNSLLNKPGGADLLPEDYRLLYLTSNKKSEKARVICDFIAGMTDRYAVEFYSRLFSGGESIFKPF